MYSSSPCKTTATTTSACGSDPGVKVDKGDGVEKKAFVNTAARMHKQLLVSKAYGGSLEPSQILNLPRARSSVEVLAADP